MIKFYLGDGVYAETDGIVVMLTTENGISVTNKIVLEIDMVQNLLNKMKEVK